MLNFCMENENDGECGEGDEFDEDDGEIVVVNQMQRKQQNANTINVIFQNPPQLSPTETYDSDRSRSRGREDRRDPARDKKRRKSAPAKINLVKDKHGKMRAELDFNIVIVGEIGDGKTSLVQAICVDAERENCMVKRAYRGVTKEIRRYRVKPELISNAYVLDSPGTGDADVSIRDLIYNMELFCKSTNISCIVLTCDASKGRCTLGARLANSLVEKGFVNSYDHVVICGTKGDRLEEEVDREEWVQNIADGINNENFEGMISHVCISSLKMRRDKKHKHRFNVDMDHESSDISQLLSCLKKVKSLGKYAEYSMPDISELVSNLALIIGNELTVQQKNEVKMLLEDQKKEFEHLLKQQQVAFTSGNIGNLLYSASKGDVSYVQMCMSNGMNIFNGDYDSRTALHLAVCEGQDEMVRFLIEHATPDQLNSQDRWGRTPLDDALTTERESIIKMLQDSGAQSGLPNFDMKQNSLRRTTNKAREIGDLLDAASQGDVAFVKKCLENGMDVYTGDYDSRTALHLAVCESQTEVVQFLVRNAQPEQLNIRDRWGRTAFDDAFSMGDQRLISILQLAGAEMGGGISAYSPSPSAESRSSPSFPAFWATMRANPVVPRLQSASRKNVELMLLSRFERDEIVWVILHFCGADEQFPRKIESRSCIIS